MNFQENIILQNKRVRLEPLNMDHFEKLFPIVQQYPELMKFSPKLVRTDKDLKTYIKIAMSGRDYDSTYAFAIYDKKEKAYAGSTRYANISLKDARLEIGWTWIGEEFQGTGLNKNCKFLLLEYAFEILNFRRIEFKADNRNEKSKKAMEKIGATYEGMLRSHMLMSDGHRRDSVFYSMLNEEWQNIRQGIFSEF